jgi:hypothetical protein
MSRITRLAVLLAALLSLCGVMSSTANAVTWHNTGDSAFTATGGAGTFTSTAVTFGCSGGDLSGTVPATPLRGGTLAVSATYIGTGCTLSNQQVTVDCGYTFTWTVWVSGSRSITSGDADVTCSIYLAGTKICHLGGPVPTDYVNPSGTTPGSFTITTNSDLTVSKGPIGNCPLGTGDTGHFTLLTFNVVDTTQPLGPVITRTD